MSDLRNSQRVSFKATYVQTKPAPAEEPSPNNPPTERGAGRAVEKTTYARKVDVKPVELPLIREKVFSDTCHEEKKSGMLAALDATHYLVNDTSMTAVLNNAARFANVDRAALVDLAGLPLSSPQPAQPHGGDRRPYPTHHGCE